MRSVVVVVPELLPVPPVQGGAIEHWVHEVTTRMVRHHSRLAIVSRPAGVSGLPQVSYIGIPWTPLEHWFHRIKVRSHRANPLRVLAKIQNVWSYGRRVAKIVRGFDIVYLHNEPNLLFFIQKKDRQRIVLHMHNDHLSLPVLRWFYKRVLVKVDVVLCVSDYIRRRAIANFSQYSDRFKVVLNATNASEFMPYGASARVALADKVRLDPTYKHLLYVGRLTHIKGVHVLIDAFARILKHYPRTRLVIAGSSFFEGAIRTPYEEGLVKLADPISDSIVFTGFLPHTTLKYLYSVSDIVVLPSIWQDPCPLVVFEAMASATCVVASAVGGVPEIIEDQYTGVLVPPANPEALVTAINDLLNNPEKKRAMESAARAKVLADYSWERLIFQVEETLGASK